MRCLFLALLGLSLVACADKKGFVGYEAGVTPDRSSERQRPAEDAYVYPDGVVFYSGEKMFAHSATQLFSIDPTTLDLAVVGTFGPSAPDINDLAVTPDGKLYGISVNDLWQIDHETAQVTHVVKVQGTANAALTFEAAGTLLGADKTGMLRRVDPKTGAVTDVGSFGTGLIASGDLVAIKDGTLFGTTIGDTSDDLVKIDPKTGHATVVGSTGFSKVYGLAFWKGTIYGLTATGELLAIAPATGKATKVRSFTQVFWGAAVSPLAPIE